MRKKDRQQSGSAKRTDNRSQKGPTTQTRKGPTNYRPVVTVGVVDAGEMVSLLDRARQGAWATPKRVAGLLLLIGFIIRKGGKSVKLSSTLAHQYVGRLKRPPPAIAQPLELLVHLEILERVRSAVVGPHLKVSAEYRIHPIHSRRFDVTIEASPQQVAKLADFEGRNEQRKNRKHSFRARLIEDMEKLSLASEGKSAALDLITSGQKVDAVNLTLESLKGTRRKSVSVDKVGTIRTFINSTPRELKSHFLINGSPSSKLDINGAHICILQRIIRDRIDHLGKTHPASPRIAALEGERAKLAATIADGDIYRQGEATVTTEERKRSKREMLTSLNMKTAVAIRYPSYRWLRSEFPLTCGIIEDIKAKDHSKLSIQLQNYTGRVINGALAEVQSLGIPAFPDTDALIVPESERTLAEEVLKRWVRAIVGEGTVSAA